MVINPQLCQCTDSQHRFHFGWRRMQLLAEPFYMGVSHELCHARSQLTRWREAETPRVSGPKPDNMAPPHE